jgi:tripeptidyl-peptidase-1
LAVPDGTFSLTPTEFVTLRCLQALYGTIDYVPQVPDQNSIATANYLDETIFKADMSIFMQRFRPDAINAIDEFEEVVIDGGSSEQDVMSPEKIAKKTNREANLDAQYAIGMTWPTNFMGYYTGGSPEMALDADTLENTNEPYLAWLDYVLEQDDLPQVISTSYADLERTVPYSLAKRVCDRFAQLGARGVSVIFASGDHGVGEDNNPACVSNEDGNPVQFIPTFPSSCPWVTSVGGVSGFNPELPANKTFSSGGGFSDYFPRPAYQQQAVQQYLDNLGDQSQGSYNSTGRGYPDVAAQGENMVIVWNGRATMIGGTSAATPVFAAVITLVNDALLAAGKPPLGFLNPWLYREGYQALNDIIGGSNRGCGVDGFPAVEGWDPVTGHGESRRVSDTERPEGGGWELCDVLTKAV